MNFLENVQSKKIALENMLEYFGYEYEYSKMSVYSDVFCVVKIYIGFSLSFLGTFFYEDLFDSFGVSKSAYSLLENFGWVIKEMR